jgi:hypothetical protein
MNTPIEPPADEPNLLETKPTIPVEAKSEQVLVAVGLPSQIEDPVVESASASKPKRESLQKLGSVFTKGLRVCGNCGTELLGETCYQCGQPVKGLVRQFSSILGDFLDTVLNIDTRVFRTIGPLIYKPGFLTQEYFSGRRIRYVSPVRLFFFLAVLTFLLAQFSLPDIIKANEGSDADNVVQINNDSEQRIDEAKTVAGVEKIRSEILAELAKTKKEAGDTDITSIAIEQTIGMINRQADSRIEQLRKEVAIGIDKHASPAKNDKVPDEDGGGNISFNGKAWDAEKNPIKVEWLPNSINKWFNSLAQRAEKNGNRINKDPKVIIEALLSALPMTLFLMLPFFSLLLKIMFIFKRRLYMEHLIVALHSHAFLMLSILLLIVFSNLSTWFIASAWVTVSFGMLTAVLWIWMPIYLFLMQKRVYQQGWILTFIKFMTIGFFHVILLSIAIAFTLVIKLIWL